MSVRFTVDVEIEDIEGICPYICRTDSSFVNRYFVGLVGNIPELGSWNPEKGLICQIEGVHYDPMTWTCLVELSLTPAQLGYRFFIAEWKAASNAGLFERRMVVVAWESRLKPRVLPTSSNGLPAVRVRFGSYEDGTFIQRGYLMSHSELRIRLSGYALKLSSKSLLGLNTSTRDLSKLRGRRLYVACRPSILEDDEKNDELAGEVAIYPESCNKDALLVLISSQQNHSSEPSLTGNPASTGSSLENKACLSETQTSTPGSISPCLSFTTYPPVLVSVLAQGRAVRRLGEHTGCHGTLYGMGDDVTFYVDTANLDDTAVEILYYIEATDSSSRSNHDEAALMPVKFLGSAFFGPFTDNIGSKGAQLLSRRRVPIGDLRISYLVINPMVGGPTASLEVSYQFHWSTKHILEIGHRGMGTYYISPEDRPNERPASIKENTLGSFKAAVDHGADFVEMDVQLTKDLKVVVYHDFDAALTSRKKRRELQLLSVSIKDMPYSALRDLKMLHSSALSEQHSLEEMDREDLDPVELQHFPLLCDCLKFLDPDLGFDIEVKYPMPFKDGGSEMENFFERNTYVDTILREIFQYAGQRRILLSCFDPDTCAMLKLKQIRYPVFQLGVETLYADSRHQSFTNLCLSAKANELLGIAVNSSEILKSPQLAEYAYSLGLILLVWGSSANNRDNKAYLRSLGVNGVIYDRMHEHNATGSLSKLKSEKLANMSLVSNFNSLSLSPQVNLPQVDIPSTSSAISLSTDDTWVSDIPTNSISFHSNSQ